MKTSSITMLCCIALSATLTACQSRQFPTLTIYDSPARFVRLEADPTVDKNYRHTHPVILSTDQMAAVLSGMIVEEPHRLLSFLDKEQEPPRHPAFKEADIRFLAPLLAKGLALATPEEVVTFYETRQDTAIIRKVTSGGVFVDGDEMRVVLSNYRSSTHYASDPGVDDTFDDRLTPMKPIAPQEAQLDFEPTGAIAASHKSRLSSLLGPERREVVVLYKRLAPAKGGAGHEAERGATKEQ